ncbi:MAG: GAF domain-containing protein [Anaerolineales bacterium]
MSSENKRPSKIARLLQSLVLAHPSIQQNVAARQQAELSASLAIAIFVLSLYIAALLYYDRRYILPLIYGFLIIAGTALVSLLLSRSRIPMLGALLLTITPSLIGFYLAANYPLSIFAALFFTVPLTMLLAAIILPIYAAGGLMAVVIIATALGNFFIPNFPRLSAYLLAVQFVTLGSAIMIVTVARNTLERRRIREIREANANLLALQQSLEQKVEERTRQVRTAAEMTQSIASVLTREELLEQTIGLLKERFDFYQAAIYLLDETERFAVLRAAHGPAAETLLAQSHRLPVDVNSLIGQVIVTRQAAVITDLTQNPLYIRNELLPEAVAEAGIPILTGNRVLGAIDIHSKREGELNEDALVTLRTIAGQIAANLENIRLMEAGRANVQGMMEILHFSYQIAQSQTEAGVIEAAALTLRQTPFVSLLLQAGENGLKVTAVNDPLRNLVVPETTLIPSAPLTERLRAGIMIGEIDELTTALPAALWKLLRQMELRNLAFVPVFRGEELETLLILGNREPTPILPAAVEPYISLAELVTASVERIRAQKTTEHRLSELEAITVASRAIASASSLQELYEALHEQIRLAMGEVSFMLALYESSTDSIHIPYMYEASPNGGEIVSYEPFPLGEGLTSILIRTRQPLMVVEDTERRLAALGAKVTGKPAQSWMGVPLLVAGEAIGAIVVQDTEREKAFDEGDLHFVSTLASQVAGAIYNIRLLEETRKRALQLQTAAEIARDISGSLDVNELLIRAVSLIRERFNFYHAAVFLIDASGEYAVIREATGEAGIQMKRAGHKLAVGSKSIVGYVSGSGEPLVVPDTTKDATYYANPLLPETRSEVALPLRVGPRILGVLDVQSTEPYAFGEEDVNVLRILADQLAVAVLNSELFSETQEHLSQHRLLHHVTTAAASGTTLEEALNSAAQGLQVTLGGDRVAILLLNKETRALEIKAFTGYSEEVRNLSIPIGSGITGWVAAHLQPLRIDDVTKDSRYVQVSGDTRSELAIPLVYRGELLGVLNVESERVGAYSENDEEMLGTLGGSLAAIIANARLLEQIRRQVDRERLLYEVTSRIRRSTDTRTIMETTVSELSKALGARRARIQVGLKPNDSGSNTSQ